MNKKLLFLVLLVFLILPLIVFAQLQPYAPGAPIINSLPLLISNIETAFWVIFTAIVIITFVMAGILFLTAQGEAEKIKTAKSAFLWGVAGVVVGIIAFSILFIIERIIVFGT